jgi:hypothetical protein
MRVVTGFSPVACLSRSYALKPDAEAAQELVTAESLPAPLLPAPGIRGQGTSARSRTQDRARAIPARCCCGAGSACGWPKKKARDPFGAGCDASELSTRCAVCCLLISTFHQRSGIPMPAFNTSSAYVHAIALVTAGLQSGVIKLNGPISNQDTATADAKYLNELINSIAKNLRTD